MPAPRVSLPAADLARTVVFAAFIAVLGIFPGIYLGGSGVPIVIQNAGPLLAGAILGARRGTASVVLLLALVAIGLPLLSGGRGGLAPFVGPSGGFLFGWIASALVTGLIVQRAERPGLPVLLMATTAGLAVDYAIGIPFLGAYTGDLGAAAVQSLVFLPGDAGKVVAAAVIAAVVHRALPGTLARPAVHGE
ncbi:BioY family transporter [Prauserella sp. PE36]|uniref:Biotin transporter n=1 Tax=Prauserella endophytica TaxID=1592324 RepID=A0ABY2SBF3_9PSEU|nr:MULTISPECIES: biotin transporter BioY [Prauserella]PXY34687.1 BioY family transporter [Prauserella coralliicola]RBM23776.1 BioY family transporter [Prauserella sp. PE36]TKG73219.1 biotin transporter BioY [Prauserella endophytica]